MARFEEFEDIEAWKKARELTQAVYTVSSSGDFNRDFGLKDQLRRASVSVLSNIAEGFEREGNKGFVQFLSLAKGSCGEVRAQLYVAFDQAYIRETEFRDLREKAQEISRLIAGLMKYLRTTEMKGSKCK